MGKPASAIPKVVDSRSRWLWPQLLSLDVVLIAVTWQMLFPWSYGIPPHPAVLFITAVVVWSVYIGDHLLDTRSEAPLSNRHFFVRRHRQPLLAVTGILLAMSVVSLRWIPLHIIGYGCLLAGVVVVYMAMVHFASRSVRRAWPKEIVIGGVFALGSSIAAWSAPHVPPSVFAAVLLFAMLCTLNCARLEYEDWRRSPQSLPVPHRLSCWIGKQFVLLTSACVAGTFVFALTTHHFALSSAMALTSLLQAGAFRLTRPCSADITRAVTDASLLTPLLFLWIAPWR